MEDVSKYHQVLYNLEHINESSVVLDIGANIGDITDLLSKRFKSHIFSYEPNISCYNFMLSRFEKNLKIHIFNLAVSNFAGNAYLYFHKNSENIAHYSQRSSLKPEKDGLDKRKRVLVKCVNIKDVLYEHERIDLIKIDVEGAEYDIMPELIKNRNKIKMVICETHGNPFGKKIPNAEGTQLVVKNQQWVKNYEKLINKLKDLNLYGSWFQDWY